VASMNRTFSPLEIESFRKAKAANVSHDAPLSEFGPSLEFEAATASYFDLRPPHADVIGNREREMNYYHIYGGACKMAR
jgi:hypothetical protein